MIVPRRPRADILLQDAGRRYAHNTLLSFPDSGGANTRSPARASPPRTRSSQDASSSGRLIVAHVPIHAGRVDPLPGITELKDPGDPVELARYLAARGAGRLLIDFRDTTDAIDRVLPVVERIASAVECPIITSLADGSLAVARDVQRFLAAGAQRYAFNTSAVRNPDWVSENVARHGREVVVAIIRARRVTADWWEPMIDDGVEATGLDTISWARELVERGVGELIVHSIDRASHGWGYDLDLTRAVADAIARPVIASGGAALPQDLVAGLTRGKASAVVVDKMIHTGRCSLETANAFVRSWIDEIGA